MLLGAVNPSARLPFTVPVDEADLPPFDRDATVVPLRPLARLVAPRAATGRAPAFPFGFGLSYTTFALDDVDASTGGDGASSSRGTVRNTGDRDGADVVQVYAELPDPDAPARLVGFARVEVDAGAATTVHDRRPARAPRHPRPARPGLATTPTVDTPSPWPATPPTRARVDIDVEL